MLDCVCKHHKRKEGRFCLSRLSVSSYEGSSAIRFRHVFLSLALANAAPAAKAGTQAEVGVRVTRLFDYTGEFKLQLVVPANVKGISADDGIVSAGQDRGKLVLRIAADAAPGNLAGLIVRATGVLHGNVPVVQDVKFIFSVLKP